MSTEQFIPRKCQPTYIKKQASFVLGNIGYEICSAIYRDFFATLHLPIVVADNILTGNLRGLLGI